MKLKQPKLKEFIKKVRICLKKENIKPCIKRNYYKVKWHMRRSLANDSLWMWLNLHDFLWIKKKSKIRERRIKGFIQSILPEVEKIMGLRLGSMPEIKFSAFYSLFFRHIDPAKVLISKPRGYFNQKKNKIGINSFSNIGDIVIHELVHAIDFQNNLFGKARAEAYEFSKSVEEAEWVSIALIEGRAKFMQLLYVYRNMPFDERLKKIESELSKMRCRFSANYRNLGVMASLSMAYMFSSIISISPAASTIGLIGSAVSLFWSLVFIEDHIYALKTERIESLYAGFPDRYQAGARFMLYLTKRLGSIEKAYRLSFRFPPRSAEEVMKPEIYVERVKAEAKAVLEWVE